MDRHLLRRSGGRSRAARGIDQSLHFDLKVDFAKLTGWSALEGLTGAAGVRYRDGLNVNNFVGASSTFNPSTYQSGKQWRLMPFFLTYATPELFGVKDFLIISGGWVNPYDIFAQQRNRSFSGIMRSSAAKESAPTATVAVMPCPGFHVNVFNSRTAGVERSRLGNGLHPLALRRSSHQKEIPPRSHRAENRTRKPSLSCFKAVAVITGKMVAQLWSRTAAYMARITSMFPIWIRRMNPVSVSKRHSNAVVCSGISRFESAMFTRTSGRPSRLGGYCGFVPHELRSRQARKAHERTQATGVVIRREPFVKIIYSLKDSREACQEARF
jgi:hypothetical protein